MVVFASDLLKEQDESVWRHAEGLFTRSNSSLERVVGLKEASKASDSQTILLIDEADKLLIDDLQEAPKNCRACIGFTATIPNH